MGEFDGKSVIVTGGALGIGGAASEAFAREGANVTILDWNGEAGDATVDRIASAGGMAQFVQADAGTSEGCRATVDAAVEAYGGVDVLFSNVGIQPPDSYVDAVELPEETWDKIIAVNLKSRFLMAKYSIPHMRKAGGGVIISSASVQGLQSMGGVSAYAASKGGDLSLMRQMSLDFAADNIRVVSVNPGAIDTPMVRNAIAGTGGIIETSPTPRTPLLEQRIGRLDRIGQTEDIANMVLFLASDRASFITGSYFNVDGGLMAMGAWADTVGADGSN